MAQQKGVQHHDQRDRMIDLPGVVFHKRRLKAAQGSRRPAKSGIAKTRIVIVEFSSAIRAPLMTTQEGVEELLMRDFLNAKLS